MYRRLFFSSSQMLTTIMVCPCGARNSDLSACVLSHISHFTVLVTFLIFIVRSWSNQSLQRTRLSRFGCKRPVRCAGSLSSGVMRLAVARIRVHLPAVLYFEHHRRVCAFTVEMIVFAPAIFYRLRFTDDAPASTAQARARFALERVGYQPLPAHRAPRPPARLIQHRARAFWCGFDCADPQHLGRPAIHERCGQWIAHDCHAYKLSVASKTAGPFATVPSRAPVVPMVSRHEVIGLSQSHRDEIWFSRFDRRITRRCTERLPRFSVSERRSKSWQRCVGVSHGRAGVSELSRWATSSHERSICHFGVS